MYFLSSFLQRGSWPPQQTPNVLHQGVGADRLRRKNTALNKILKDTETNVEILSDDVDKLIAEYEQHLAFLRSVAYKAASSNASVQKSQMSKQAKYIKLTASFERIVEMIQLAKLKAEKRDQDVENLMQENAKLKAKVEELEDGRPEDARKRAEDRWLVSEREGQEQNLGA
ncbi:hypothetical protein K458DRAFT_404492 [Lentithecium fluviatile CBS 122367]|uniref:Uncharacterized protein n=1 Tax=Lentithecium fluviatile CBS 122367 TaxID=1168545 RepID=A0A6G1J1E8_9PLEO|nr:hypothetical protein K458DRAFT_404492 [Lentithecium fluviatile CBS 122367]